MIKFIYQYDESSPMIEVTLHRDSTLDEVISGFEGFIKAAGYEPGQNLSEELFPN